MDKRKYSTVAEAHVRHCARLCQLVDLTENGHGELLEIGNEFSEFKNKVLFICGIYLHIFCIFLAYSAI